MEKRMTYSGYVDKILEMVEKSVGVDPDFAKALNPYPTNLIQLTGAPAPGYRYVCQKCNEVLTQQDVEIDGNGGLIHQSDVDCTGDPPNWKPIWCGPVHQEPIPHDAENCADPDCEEPACKRQRVLEAGELRADAQRDEA